ncbi:MAG: hypothetical protein ACRDYY_00375, partial [Acidimicrobiales bacterium]
SGSATVTAGNGAATGRSTASAGVRRIEGPEAEPVDLLAVAGGSTVKRLLPVAGVVAFILLLLGRRKSRRARKARGLLDEVLG